MTSTSVPCRFLPGLFGLSLGAALLASLTGCFGQEETRRPDPKAMTSDDQSYFCGMTAAGHPGPKAQIHLLGKDAPLWFAATRDAVGFIRLPDENNEITAIYVTDMAKADWNHPDPGPWIALEQATLVIESKRRGGMGAPAVIPFSSPVAARDFIQQNGGRIVALDDIPSDYVLGMVDIPDNPDLSGFQ